MKPINEKTIFHTPELIQLEAGGMPLLLDADAPNWAAIQPRGVEILSRCDGRTPAGRIVADYATARRPSRSWTRSRQGLAPRP